MSILIDENTTFIIQGITGREAFSDRTMNGAAWDPRRMPQPCLPAGRLSSYGGDDVADESRHLSLKPEAYQPREDAPAFKLGWS